MGLSRSSEKTRDTPWRERSRSGAPRLSEAPAATGDFLVLEAGLTTGVTYGFGRGCRREGNELTLVSMCDRLLDS